MSVANGCARLLVPLILLSALNAQAGDKPSPVCADLADHARTLLEDAKVAIRVESMDPRDPKAPTGCRVTLTGGRATGRDPLERLNHYIRERGWARTDRQRPPIFCHAQSVRDPAGIEILCLPGAFPRPALPVTRLKPTVRGESQPDDPNLIRLPDGRVLPRPAAPQAPMTDQPLDWKTKP